jgi:hypothetical protein
MPLVIRGNDRRPHRVDSAGAIEIVDNDGGIAVVIMQSPSGSVQIVTPGNPLFKSYCLKIGGVASRVHVHEDYASKKL